MEQEIIRLFSDCGLGAVILPLTQVSGGLMHRMYRVNTAKKSYAVKCLNPEIMKRPDAKANFDRAERLEGIIEKTDIPIVPALVVNGRKMQCVDGLFFYIFDWHEGSITDWNHISDEQCRIAGIFSAAFTRWSRKEGRSSPAMKQRRRLKSAIQTGIGIRVMP